MFQSYTSRNHGVRAALIGLPLFAIALLLARQASADCTLVKTYSTFADFGEGTPPEQMPELIVGPDDIQVKTPPAMLPFINVACSGRGTMTRIFVGSADGIVPPVVLGEYRTAPEGRLNMTALRPSRSLGLSLSAFI